MRKIVLGWSRTHRTQRNRAKTERRPHNDDPQYQWMALRPWTLVWTFTEVRVQRLAAQLGLFRRLLLLEELGVVVNRRVELLVSIIENYRTAGWTMKINPSLQLLQTSIGDFEWLIVAVMNFDLDDLLSGSGKLDLLALGIDPLA